MMERVALESAIGFATVVSEKLLPGGENCGSMFIFTSIPISVGISGELQDKPQNPSII
jgi:hypothetical protein